jgi:hypothetical protein
MVLLNSKINDHFSFAFLPSILAPMKTSCSAKLSTPTLRTLANF